MIVEDMPVILLILIMSVTLVLPIIAYIYRTKFPPSFIMFLGGAIWILLFIMNNSITIGYADPTIANVTDITDIQTISGLTQVYTTNYSNTTGWTKVDQDSGDASDINIGSGTLNFNSAEGGSNNNRQTMYDEIEQLSNIEWRADGKFRWTAQTAGGSFYIFAMTENNGWVGDGTSNDRIGVIYSFSVSGRLGISVNDGTSMSSSSFITGIASSTDYYWRLDRLDATTTRLSVFSDSARTTHISGSPVLFSIPSGITALDTIQHSNAFGDGTGNILSAIVDDLTIYNFVDSTQSVVIGQDYEYNDIEPIDYSIRDSETGEPSFYGIMFIILGLSFMVIGALIEWRD